MVTNCYPFSDSVSDLLYLKALIGFEEEETLQSFKTLCCLGETENYKLLQSARPESESEIKKHQNLKIQGSEIFPR